jgi:hypothetical protein
MKTNARDNLEVLSWASREVRDLYARTHDFSAVLEFVDGLNDVERTMLWNDLFWQALQEGIWEFAEKCVDSGYSLKAATTERSGFSPLHDAMIYLGDRLDVIQWLIAHGADIEQRDNSNAPPLIAAVGRGFTDIAEFLVKEGANVNSSTITDDDLTPLMVAATGGYEKIVTLLLENGADVDRKNRWGFDAAELAQQSGHEELARLIRDSSL